MICFRDQSYCAESAECGNDSCDRKWSEELAQQARKWLGSEGAPVDFVPMKHQCGRYEENVK